MRAINNRTDYVYVLLVLLFIIGNTYLIAIENYLGLLIPAAIAVVALALIKPEFLLPIIAFFTPLSTSLEELGLSNPLGVEMALPTEPLLFGLMIVSILKVLKDKGDYYALFKHPISISIGLYLAWLLLTSLTSSMPLVSVKMLITRMWFIFTFYILAAVWFRNQDNIFKVIKAYILGLFIVAIYTMIMHASHNFEHEAAHWVMSPFFKDHTSYGMALALILPLVFYLANRRSSFRALYMMLLAVLVVAIVLSYTRAAWLSLIAAAGVFVIMKLRIRFASLISVFAFVIAFLAFFQTEIMMSLEKNSQDSSDSFVEHIESMTNVSTDASNLERINRWKSAIRLFQERPHLGWGAGTYQFQYAPYQNFYEKTIISTNAGNMGNAHSEYLSALAETGWPGLLTFLLLIVVVFTKAINLYTKLNDENDKALIMAVILGLVTYFTHAFLNNFLDMDKASVPIWLFVAIIVSIDMRTANIPKSVS